MNLLSKSTRDAAGNNPRALLEAQLREATAAPEIIPLSFSQQRLWLLDQLEPNSALYNVPLALEFQGALNTDALQKAVQQLVQRHEVLRTRFQCVDESPVQVVEPAARVKVLMHEVGHLGAGSETAARRLVNEEIHRPFDLNSGPLLRVLLIRFGAERHWFILNFHHIVSDEWSLRICLRELSALYDSFHRGRVSGLPELPVQYADYSLWQRERLLGEPGEKQLAYWRERLQEAPPALELPADRPRPAIPRFQGATLWRPLAPQLGAALKDLAGRNGASLYMVLLAAFKTLVHRYTGQSDLVIGSPIAGRNQLETEDLIGFFVNTLVLRTSLAKNPTFMALLERVRETTLGAYANQDLPFEKLVESLRPERTLHHNPFTRIMFALQNQSLESIPWHGLKVRLLEAHTNTSKFDLTLMVQETSAGLTARAEFDTDLFETETIQRLLANYETLLAGIVDNPHRRLSELPLLSPAERRILMSDWNPAGRPQPADRTVAACFEAQAERTPDAIAVGSGRESLTYAELNARANQLARHLMNLAVGPNVPVGICMERSPSLIIAMLAILKTGAAYVPLDPSYPKPRLFQMLEDSRAPVLITEPELLTFLPNTSARVVCVNSDWEFVARESKENLPNRAASGESPAYIMYTSGSTGRPKGVIVPHRAILRLVLDTNYIQLTPSDRIAQASNTSFDAATFEIWGALLNGARLVNIATDVALSPREFSRELREQGVTVLFLTTALFNQIAADQPDAFACLRVLLFGGETADPKWVRAVLDHPPRQLLHVYGPTENTTFSTWHEVRGADREALNVPIGRPVTHTRCHLLDGDLNPVPIGAPGELHLTGDGLALGYWNQEELTAKKFIPNPFASPDDGPSGRLLYKTGDRVRWRSDGTLEFLGRTDKQVKLRGFRVELGEIETVLSRHPAVRDCAVAVCGEETGDKRLVAYFVPHTRRGPGLPELRRYLRERLPDYMVPSSFIRLESMPLTPNGKVNRAALPEPDRVRPELEKRYATPQDAVEVELTRIWESVLGIHPVGIQDKFFELGGHSLLAVRVIAQIEKQFGRKLKLATIFQAQTIEQLAAILRKEIHEDSAISGTSIVEIQPRGTRPPLFLVHGAGGGMFWGYVNLSRHLGPDQPVYGLRSRALDGREEFPSIEQMAEQYIADMRVVQPRGPYHIGGYCFGGNVAYEMARQLQAQGEQVATLALFNCAPANSRYSHISWSPRWFFRFGLNLGYWLKYFCNWTPEQRHEFFRWKREMWKRRADRLLGNADTHATVDAGELVDLSSFTEEQRRLWESHIHALVNYHPQPFPGRVHLFRSPGHPWLCSFDPDYGWGDLARGGVEIRTAPGVHEKLLEEPCVAALACQVNAVLAQNAERASVQPAGVQHPPRSWNQNAADFPVDRSYAVHFELQAARTPNALALKFKGQELSYAELNARANRLAHRLKQAGIGPESLAAVCLERSADLPVTLLAILKAGGAYLPLDRSYPAERLAYMLSDSAASALVTERAIAAEMNSGQARLICIDDPEEQARIAALPDANPATHAGPDNLAYVIYTSGSTGMPKGVQITHRSLLNHNFSVMRAYELRTADRVLQFSPFSFDISVEELFPTWLSGAALVMRTDDDISSVSRFLKLIRSESVSVINLPTAYWHELVEQLREEPIPESLRVVIIGGEKASPEAWRRWKQRAGSVKVINTYGPTEATVIATLHVGRPEDDWLPIGRPLPNTQALILDEQLNPVPIGAEGELHIGGAGLARGYLNRPELTAQKFIPNPFPEIPSDRLYKTGDLARFRPDGTIEFAGRRDEQVKIRGFRIELGEIETALASHAAIRDAVVIAREDVPGRKRLVAYYVCRDGQPPRVREFRDLLKAKLPAYMVPSAFVQLESLPMTPSGKVDRKNLPIPADTRPDLDQKYVAPRTPLEEVISRIWSEVLELSRVGVEDNFFDLGGHSLLAIRVISRLREAVQVEVPLASIFTFPTVATLADSLSQSGGESQPVLPVSAVANGRRLPLTDSQRRVWFLDHFEPQQSSYNIPTVIRLAGPLNLRALEQALTELARRHDALRAVFPFDDDQPVQVICEPKEIRLSVVDLRDVPEEDREARVECLAVQEGRRSYALSNPMLRTFLWRLGDEDHLLMLLTHELACDAHSVKLLYSELTTLYAAFNAGGSNPLSPVQFGYEELVLRPTPPREEHREGLEFWKKQLQGAPPLLELPGDRPRPAHQTDAGARTELVMDAPLVSALEALAESNDTPLFATLLAGFNALLSRYSGSTDIVVGSLIPNRNDPQLRDIIAHLQNTIVLRADLSGDPAFADILGRVRDVHRAALAHGTVPFERVVDELRPERNASYTPVFQVMFTFEPEPLPEVGVDGTCFIPASIDNRTTKLDLRLHLERKEGGILGFIEYSTALFNDDRMARMAEHYRTLLRAVAQEPALKLSRIPLMPPQEAACVLTGWNSKQLPYPKTATLISLFEKQSAQSPQATALVAGTDRLTYTELNARANQLAHHLRTLGVRPGVMVGICMERNWPLAVSILGVLKAGGAYVPLDPAYPRDRLSFILQDSNAPVLLTQDSLRPLLPTDAARVVCIDSDWAEIRTRSRENPRPVARAGDLAYVIYTSGSTGQPKGVAIENRAVVAFVYWAKEVYSARELSGVLASTSICFDLSIFELFVPWSWGGTVILAQNALALPELPAAGEVTLINTVPSAIRELLRVRGIPPNVSVVNLAGEPLTTPVVNQIYAETQVKKVYDLYGPSETTTYSTFILRQPQQPATIGRPLANEQVYLLDSNQQPVPVGIPGELYIGGDKLARGYLNRPELTAERFVPNPFTPGTRLYRTGDLARWRADGQLEFLGRIDHQVKIRGFRIELGEIEAAYRRHSAVQDIVVMARDYENGPKRLVAYVAAKPERRITADDLRRFGKEHLPEYMVPPVFVFLDELPLTPNGKVDRKALPDPEDDDRVVSTPCLAPRSPVEAQLADIWREVLRLKQVGVQDNFFELGGDSLLAIQVISRVRETCKVELPLFSVFEAPTIELLSQGLQSGVWTENQLPVLPLTRIPRDGRLPVAFVQERLWFLDQLEPGDHAYNVAVALRLKGKLQTEALERAVTEIARRHEALRTTFAYEDGILTQKISPPQPVRLECADLSTAGNAVESRLQDWLKREGQRPFDLAAGPLLRVHLARLNDAEHALLVVMHHTISDGWSITLLFQELETCYDGFVSNTAVALPELPLQYVDFASWKRQQLQGALLDQELAFWKNRLAGAPDSIPLPFDHAPGEQTRNHAGRELLCFPRATSDAIAQVSHRQNSTAFVVLTAALSALLEKWTHQRDLVIGTVVAGRNRREMENVIGCFMNFLPIRTRLSGEETGAELLGRVKSAVLEVQEHQDCPFEKIVEAVNPARRTNQNPLYNVALLLQNFPAEMFRSAYLESSPLPLDLEAALLDLRFEAEWNGGQLQLACEYKTDLFEKETIAELLRCYQQLLEAILFRPEARLADQRLSAALENQARSARSRETALTVAVAATFTAEPIEESLRYWARELDLSARVEFAPYNQVFQELLDPGSLLSANSRGVNVLLIRPEDWIRDGQRGSIADALNQTAAEFVAALRSAATRSSVPFLTLLCPRSPGAASDPERNAALDSVEQQIARDLDSIGSVQVVTASELQDLYRLADCHDPSGDELGRVPYTPPFFTALGTMVARKLLALNRASHKVIVLDCDNTLWSGVCGEDGHAGICLDGPRKALQEFMRAQQEAGRLLAVCSKNNEEDVREVFARRLDMPLRHEHFAAWRTNWLPKSENLRSLARELNLGLDSFIFIDDNPVECAEVEVNCPEVLTLLLPEDSSRIPQFLRHCWAFDHARLTAEDRKRGEMYRENLQREQLRSHSMNLADFIASLNLQIEIAPMSDAQLARVSQLTHRTNQFNCTTIRRSESEIRALAGSAEVLAVSVRDRFGDYGLVGVMIFSANGAILDVETFLLSCRVLGRGVEHAMLARLGQLAKERNLEWVDVHYHRSEKNKPAFDFLENVGSQWRQALNGGFVYRFPVDAAARMQFTPSESREAPAPGAESPRKDNSRSATAPTTSQLSGNRFRRYRALALECCDPLQIHAAIESRTSKRSGRRGDFAPPETEMERKVCALWQQLLRVDVVGVNDNFFELGGHSLLAVRLFAELEKITGRKFPLVTLFQAPTVRELARVLADDRNGTAQSPIVGVHPQGSRPPLFLAHGAGGDVLWGYANLAQHLSPEQPIYGIKSRGQIGLEEFERIEDMARYYVEEMRKIQPHGPYYVGGYCLGGNVAYEMARQLRTQGEEVALVALIDAFPSNAGYERVTWWQPAFPFRFARNLWYWLEDFEQQTPEERQRFLVRKARTLGRKFVGWISRRKSQSQDVDLEEVIDPTYFPEHELKFWQIHLRALVNHVEQPYPGAVTLIRTRGQPFLCSFAEDFCWGRLAQGGVAIRRIPGSHENIFVEPNVRHLAAEMEAALTEARRSAANTLTTTPALHNEPA